MPFKEKNNTFDNQGNRWGNDKMFKTFNNKLKIIIKKIKQKTI